LQFLGKGNSTLHGKKSALSSGKIQHFSGKISTQLRKNSALLRKKLVCTTDIEPTISQILTCYLLNKNAPGP